MVGAPAIQGGVCVLTVQVQAELPTSMTRSQLTRQGGMRIARVRMALLARDGDLCRRCATPIDMTLPGTHMYGPTIGHVVAASHGGTDYMDNLRLEHRRCNLRASDRDVPRASILQARAVF